MNKKTKTIILLILAVLLVVTACYFLIPSTEDKSNDIPPQISEENKNLPDETIEQIDNTASTEEKVVTLSDLDDYQLSVFKDTAHYFIEGILIGETPAQIHTQQEFILESFIMENELPQNALLLFKEWKNSVDYDAKLAEWANTQGTKVEVTDPVEVPDEEIVDAPINVPQQQNKPQPSQQQQQQQQQGTTSNGYKGATGEPYTYVNQYGVTIHVNEYGVELQGNEGGVWDMIEETGGEFHSTAQLIMVLNPGLSYDEAYEIAESGDFSGINW